MLLPEPEGPMIATISAFADLKRGAVERPHGGRAVAVDLREILGLEHHWRGRRLGRLDRLELGLIAVPPKRNQRLSGTADAAANGACDVVEEGHESPVKGTAESGV